jgi:hypothetical protein
MSHLHLDEYTGKVISQHRQKPRFMETLAESLRPLVDAGNVIEQLPEAFDLDTSIGAQLDVDGEWINLSRRIEVPVPNPWFTWGDPRRGWGKGIWFQPYELDYVATFLDDDTYRRLLKARILANQWDGTSIQAKAILDHYFGGTYRENIVDDKQTMEIVYALTRWIPDSLTLEIFRGQYLPLEVAGTRTYHLVTSVQNTPIFGWGLDNDHVGGWGSGAWGVDPLYLIQNPPAEGDPA